MIPLMLDTQGSDLQRQNTAPQPQGPDEACAGTWKASVRRSDFAIPHLSLAHVWCPLRYMLLNMPFAVYVT